MDINNKSPDKQASEKASEMSEAEKTDKEETDAETMNDGDQDADDSDDDHLRSGSGSPTHVGRKSFMGQTCTLKTLVDDEVLRPGDSNLHMEYMGAKFSADLMVSGSIRSSETKQVFSTPSSWVNHCKKIVNPENSGKTGSAWSTIKYNGKRLDSYKLRWYRRQKKIINNANLLESALVFNPSAKNCNNNQNNNNHGDPSSAVMTTSNGSLQASGSGSSTSILNNTPLGSVGSKSVLIKDFHYPLPASRSADEDPVKMKIRNVIEHSALPAKQINSSSGSNNIMMSCGGKNGTSGSSGAAMIKAIPFSSLDRIQPFTITMSTNALLLIDFHCHLTTGEVTGYLAGSWDLQSHNLSVLQAYPIRCKLNDREKSGKIEEEIRSNLDQRNLSVVGWYHSHPKSSPHPTLKDIESQMEYQLIMRGESDNCYIPCIGLICSPYDEYNDGLESSYQSFWAMPPPEYRPFEYPRPMQMLYSVTRDSFLTQDLLLEMRLLAHFYVETSDAVKFSDDFIQNQNSVSNGSSGGVSFWEKLQSSLKPNLPRDLQMTDGQSLAQVQVQQQALTHFWAFLKGLLIPSSQSSPTDTNA